MVTSTQVDWSKAGAAATFSPEEEALVETEAFKRRAQAALGFSKYLLIGGGIAAIGLGGAWLFAPQYTQLPAFVLSVVPLMVTSVLYPLLFRRKQATAGIYLIIASLILLMAVAPVLLPELVPAVAFGQILIIIVSSLLLDAGQSRWLIGVTVLVFAADVVLVNVWSSSPFPPLEGGVKLIAAGIGPFALLIVALIARQTILDQERATRQSQLASLEIERRAAAEQAQREQLEAQRTELEQANTEIQKRAAAEQTQREYLETTVQNYVEYAVAVGRGNLSLQLDLDHDRGGKDDPLFILGQSLNDSTASLRVMIAQIREMATQVAEAAAEIQAATTQQSASTSEQESAVSQTMTTVDEVRTTVRQTAERAQMVAGTAQQSVDVSRAGQEAVDDTIDGMDVIRQRVESIAANILMLSERTQQIGEIIQTVNDIADQSKLLALNASIEAARAGEDGKGFGVVAMEVRQLADQSRQATARVRDILGEIQQATNTAVMVTEEGSKGTERGMTLVKHAGDAIRDLASVIEEASQAATQIAASTYQQTNGMDQLVAAMASIKQASAQAAASTRQAERSSQQLLEMARRMEEVVARYEL
ncbi:MAG: hypothetical protein JXB47_10240 [Anaerolineae bacterium]|nr:hypothetical protein [Anaerolineae bacterium]